MDDGITLRDYVAALISKWWVILLILAVTAATALLASYQLSPMYQVRTQLLLVSRTSAGLTSAGAAIPNVTSALSVDTLSNLALANDLLEDIIQTLSLGSAGDGPLLPVEALAGTMKVQIKVAEQGTRSALPLLILTVQGEDPVLLKRIADTWAALFIQRNASLFASESARSFEFIQSQYEETRQALLSKTQEKLEYQRQNPLDTMRSTLEGQLDLFKQFSSDLDTDRVVLVTTQAEREELAQALESEPRILDESKVFINGAVVEKALNPLYISIKEKLTDAATREASLAANVAQLEKKVEEYRASIAELSPKVEEIQMTESTFDREIDVLTSSLQTLAAKLQEARLAKDEQGGVIRVVESPIVPQLPIGPRRSQLLLPAAGVGLLVGTLMALMVHYVQKGTLKAASPTRTRTEA